ncbi:BTAD domain-containing putative transcriptional regulator [Streptomyces arenae]|uniref:BTAD domain-containing putative transcriptional regulator n=1 Tax=Streptomyces arenae TaxID=29301 RepID=UPI0026599A38|nr:BTAD domain-containing putative transcriptional regulator [Streptomyces arenae]MCG7207039.1 tetratricopeptide repeat protein [Streptomyces arenae]
MRFGILGPLDLRTDDGTPLDPGGPRPRALLALLLLDAGRAVSTQRLTDGLYGAEPPAGAANALQSQVSRLRRRLAPHGEIEATATGYRLVTARDSVDAHRFEELAAAGRAALAAGDHARAAARLREALALWRGPALPDLPDAPAEAARLEELRLAAVQDRIEAELALGGGAELVPELRALLADRPLSERLYGQLMRALHAGGRPAEALTVFEEARRTLADELGADPSPELSALHLDLLRGVAPERPRLPVQLTRFVGREPELGRIAAVLAGSRLVTLTGPGGAGKTRLAIEAAQHRPAACFVELAPLTDGARIPYAVLAALGVREGLRSPAADITDRLLAALEDRELLLVLDNCEHLVAEAARVVSLLLAACPGVRVLATSRESLGITGEILVPVPPLPPEPAVRLFLDRARAVRPGFEGHARVAGICAALDGLPLAIELAAARLRTLTPDELADRLDDRFRLLSRGDRSKAPRHRTLRAVVEWSWDLLDEEERELARQLTVFSGGATLAAVEAVCGLAYPEDVLASLVEKSFLEVSEGRYRMLETIRAFAAEEPRDLKDAHARYFLRLAEEAEPHLRGGGQLPWLARLAAEHGNLDAALRHLVRHDTDGALRLMGPLSWFWRLRGLYGERVTTARELLAAVGDAPPAGLEEEYVLCAVNALSGAGEETELIARVDAVLDAYPGPLRLPYILVLWAVAAGPRPAADDHALALAGDSPWARALLDVGLGFRAQFAGRPQESEECFSRALAGYRATGDRWGMANCLDPLGLAAHARGESGRALELLDEGLAYMRELAAPEETADVLRSRGTVLLHRGDTAAAEAHFEEALTLARGAGLPDKAAAARRGLGDAARLAGDPARARVHYEHALQECAANWFSVGETVRGLLGLGRAAAAEGHTEEARDWFRQAAGLAVEGPGVLELADVAEALASVAGTAERAAVLLGAATGLRGVRSEADPDVVRVVADVRARLSPEEYDRAHERGRRQRSAAVSER